MVMTLFHLKLYSSLDKECASLLTDQYTLSTHNNLYIYIPKGRFQLQMYFFIPEHDWLR